MKMERVEVDIEIGGGGLQQGGFGLSAGAIFVGAVRAIVGGGQECAVMSLALDTSSR
jgi:hypothetical protein